ncbi:MAG: hypothetical protein U0903_04360 [Planctomycetales bacterium]
MSDQQPVNSSGCARLSLVIFATVGLGVSLLCAGLGSVMWWGLKELSPSFDPQTGLQVVRTIADIEIPTDLTCRFSIRMQTLGITGVMFHADKADETLILSQFHDSKYRGEFKNQLERSGKESGEDLEVTETKPREFKIRGKTAKFDFITGKSRNSKAQFRQVIGEFPGLEGNTDFVYFIPADKYDEARIVKIIESIK